MRPFILSLLTLLTAVPGYCCSGLNADSPNYFEARRERLDRLAQIGWSRVALQRRFRCLGGNRIETLKTGEGPYGDGTLPGANPLLCEPPDVTYDYMKQTLTMTGDIVNDNSGRHMGNVEIAIGKLSADQQSILPRFQMKSDGQGHFSLTIKLERDDVLFLCNQSPMGGVAEYSVGLILDKVAEDNKRLDGSTTRERN